MIMHQLAHVGWHSPAAGSQRAPAEASGDQRPDMPDGRELNGRSRRDRH
jgi:hypothetical protein